MAGPAREIAAPRGESSTGSPDVRERLRQIGAEAVPRENRSPEYLQMFVEREIAKWAVAIKAAKLAAQ